MTAKSLLLSSGDGTAVPAGAVGESKTASASASASGPTTLGNYLDIPGASLSLQPGTWMLFGNIGASTPAVSGGAVVQSCEIRDSANNMIVRTYGGFTASTTQSIVSSTLFVVVSVSSTTTYKLSVSPFNASGSPVISDGGFYYAASCAIRAVRIG